MNINVPLWARDEFWQEPPPGTMEFWGFRFPPPCAVGDRLIFRFDGRAVAEATVARIEPPGASECEHSGRFRNRWKVFWTQESFHVVGSGGAVNACPGAAGAA